MRSPEGDSWPRRLNRARNSCEMLCDRGIDRVTLGASLWSVLAKCWDSYTEMESLKVILI